MPFFIGNISVPSVRFGARYDQEHPRSFPAREEEILRRHPRALADAKIDYDCESSSIIGPYLRHGDGMLVAYRKRR